MGCRFPVLTDCSSSRATETRGSERGSDTTSGGLPRKPWRVKTSVAFYFVRATFRIRPSVPLCSPT